jgi:TP53 regulating kinase-like protein
LIKTGAEADIYITEWYGMQAISKVRTPKPYRHPSLDSSIRKRRTLNESSMLSNAKLSGIVTPRLYFVDPSNAEIIMEFIDGVSVKNCISAKTCFDMGKYAALLHDANIIHGDLTTSNFIKPYDNAEIVVIDFGLAFYSERMEDRAVDIRLIKEIFASAHTLNFQESYNSFIDGYTGIAGVNRIQKLLEKVREIEKRGRYARMT